MDKVITVQLVPKLTDCHLDPGSQLAMRLKLATQIFSSQVATALNVYASVKLLPENALSTAFFIKNMDILFEILNSRKPKADKPTHSALTLNNNFIQQLEDLDQGVEFLWCSQPKRYIKPLGFRCHYF